MGTIEASEVVAPEEKVEDSDTSSMTVLIPKCLSLLQQQQLATLLEQYQDIFLSFCCWYRSTSVLKDAIKTEGPPVQLPNHWPNLSVWWEEAK